jgi:hypothetical protein
MAPLVAVDWVLHVESVLDLAAPCLLEVNSIAFLFKAAPSLMLVRGGGKLSFLSAMVESDRSSKQKKRVKEVRWGVRTSSLAMQNEIIYKIIQEVLSHRRLDLAIYAKAQS